MTKTTALFSLLFISLQIFAQRNASWTIELPGDANEIFLHTLTGVPIIQGDGYYAGLNVEKQSIQWTINRSGKNSLKAALGKDDGLDFYEVINSPFAVINNTLIDTRDGKILMDKEKDTYKKIEDYEFLPSINAFLIRSKSEDNFIKFHLIDMNSSTQKWANNIIKSSSSLMGALAKDEVPKVVVPTGTTPLILNNTFILFQYNKEISMISLLDGSVKWSEEFEVSKWFFSADNKTIYLIENDKGGLLTQAMYGDIKRFGKIIMAFDIESGKKIWSKPLETDGQIAWYELRGDRLLIVDSKGCNFYSLADGKKIWKDAFDESLISKVEENSEGFLITYGYKNDRTMQIDPNGKKLWKKHQIIQSKNPETTAIETAKNVSSADTFNYKEGSVVLSSTNITFFPGNNSKKKKFGLNLLPDTKVEFDKKRKTFLIYKDKEILLVNPDLYDEGGIFKKTKTDGKDIVSVEIRESSYYFSGVEDFVIVRPEGEVIERHYKEPADRGAFLKGALQNAMNLGSAYMAMSGTVKMMKGAGDIVPGELSGSKDVVNNGVAGLNQGSNEIVGANALGEAANFIPESRKSVFSQTQNFAYFFTKEKQSNDKVLIKISKDTGEELDKLIFSDASPLYKVDEVLDRVIYAYKKQLRVFDPK